MLEHDAVSPNGSNGSSPDSNVTGKGTVEFDGEQFEYRENSDEIEVVIPDDYPEDKIPGLEKKVDEFKHTLASAKRKAYEANLEKQDLAEERKKLAEEREALMREREQLSHKDKTASKDNALLEAFGVETWDDVNILREENSEAYHKGLAKYNAAIASQDAYQRFRNESIKDAIRAEGYNPMSVEAFAKIKGITNLDTAYDYYKRVNEKPKGTSLAEIQKKAVKFVPKGTGTSTASKPAPGMKEMLKESNN